MWPYALNAGVVSIFYRISGIIFERTSEVGEVLIAEGDQVQGEKTVDPACIGHNVSDLMSKSICIGLEYSTMFYTFVAIAVTVQTSSP